MRYYHSSTVGSQELVALVGQNGANRGNRGDGYYGFTTNEELKTENVESLLINDGKEI